MSNLFDKVRISQPFWMSVRKVHFGRIQAVSTEAQPRGSQWRDHRCELERGDGVLPVVE